MLATLDKIEVRTIRSGDVCVALHQGGKVVYIDDIQPSVEASIVWAVVDAAESAREDLQVELVEHYDGTYTETFSRRPGDVK